MDIKASVASMILSLRNTVRSAGPSTDTVGRVALRTNTCLDPIPHCPRKLHRVIEILYRAPFWNRLEARTGGGVRLVISFNRADSGVMSTPTVAVALIVVLIHALPPLPLDPDTSRDRESQLPRTVGALIATVGTIGSTGVWMLIVFVGAVAQVLYLEQAFPSPLSPTAWHRALICDVLIKLSDDPTLAQRSLLGVPWRRTFTVAVSSH